MTRTGGKVRLDRLLVERGLAESRTRAEALILAGRVTVRGLTAVKPGTPVPAGAELSVTGPEHPWVSRGGVKLAAALDHFGVDPSGKVCLDVGASTGGFTDVLLSRGARTVYAVDVGYGQLHARLRSDPRVVLLEKVNARYLSTAEVPAPVELLVADVSFISLTMILPAAVPLLAPGAAAVLLVKPQFESERGEVGKGGIVRDPAVRERAVARVAFAAAALGLAPLGTIPSPIEGADGNREFLAAFRAAKPADSR
ncbi:MAG TPA: TlyA family RNA methyltransferase [Thermoanaerobaculia bacterium]|nr:TlyA family RNA methyltransferase [Thermoanaerobaculia bacterium]HQR67476.1 TlyA family RNA methyltransferase [Thermoanaerobaculia bacterium]